MKNRKEQAKYTYCNPLSIPDIPRGKDEWYQYEHGMFSHENKPADIQTPDYRSISDPTVFYHGGKWYLYPSYGMAWVSEDFQNWKHVRTEPYCPKYSPTIIPWKDKFLLTSWLCPLYVADNPLGTFELMGDFIRQDGTLFTPCDPGLFADDDGRLYLYAFDTEPNPKDPNKFICKIVGYELDWENPRQVIQGPKTILKMNPDNVWERRGRYHQDKTFGWVEGPHLLKHNGRYYMIYAAPDTCDTAYAMAVYYSDASPLEGFICQKRNPLTFHEGGLITGAGHGCVEHGPNGSLWAFYTIATPCLHRYERRIGMDRVDVDENGELYCPFGVTETPQYIPGYMEDKIQPNLVSLTSSIRPEVSSYTDGHYPIYATDESNITWWQPEKGDKTPWIECDMQGTYCVSAVRLYWRDIHLDYAANILPTPIGFILEGYKDGEWFTLLDSKESPEEKNIDYRFFQESLCEKVRLRITSWNKKSGIGLVDFSVFGYYQN